MAMSISSAPPLLGGSEAFMLTAWDICCQHNAGLSSVAKGLALMGVGLAVLMETKMTDDRYPHLALGYKILASKAMSHNQGGIALLWKENHGGYEMELVHIVMPTLLTFQLVTGDKQFHRMGIYIPPTDRMGVEDLRAAWKTYPAGCTPNVLGELNIDFRDPWNKREELIANLLDDISIADTSRRFVP